MFIHTPKRRSYFLAYMALVFALQPFVVTWYYSETLARGWYPLDGDSIGIPIFENLVLWVAALPFAIAMLWWIGRRYSPRVSIWIRSAQSLWRTVVFTVLAAVIVVDAVLAVVEGVREDLWLYVVYGLLAAHAVLTFRASALGARVV